MNYFSAQITYSTMINKVLPKSNMSQIYFLQKLQNYVSFKVKTFTVYKYIIDDQIKSMIVFEIFMEKIKCIFKKNTRNKCHTFS
jgi:hypothetical protein